MIRYHKVRLLKYGQLTLKKRVLYYKISLYENTIRTPENVAAVRSLGPLHKESKTFYTKQMCYR